MNRVVLGLVRSLALLILLLIVTAPLSAQTSTTGAIAGAVRDTSGAVIPGVTVEAASPALIEKVRSVVTDEQGRYRIVDLRPGTYSVTFTLPGFSTVKQADIMLSAGFAATVNAEMKVGSLEETVTVAGASPVVDTQNARQQSVVTTDLLQNLPTGSTSLISISQLTPGMVGNTTVGGSAGVYLNTSQYGTTFHGKGGNGSVYVEHDGMRVANVEQNGGTGYIGNTVSVQEVVMETGGISAESPASSVVMNMIPKDGGNKFSGDVVGLYTNKDLQAENLNDELRARGLTVTPRINHVFDANFSLGGPIMRDRLWFYTAHRIIRTQNQLTNTFFNATQGTPFYTPDLSRPGFSEDTFRSDSVRLAWQASRRNKLTVFADNQHECQCGQGAANVAPEAQQWWDFSPQGLYQVTWNFPVSNKLLIEAGGGLMISHWPNPRPPQVSLDDISIQESSTAFRYNATIASLGSGYGSPKDSDRYAQRATLTYVTGTHAFKTGLQLEQMVRDYAVEANGDVAYTFLRGVPSSITEFATPFREKERVRTTGAFAQDQWTINHLTLNMGVRWDHVYGYVPAQQIGAGPWVPARNFAGVENIPNWNDINPRIGAAYDLFGNGKTAIKAQFGRYVGADGGGTGFTQRNNPMSTSVFSASRTWHDDDKDFVPDCDLANPLANNECEQLLNLQFGQANPNASTTAANVKEGWYAREFLWDSSVEVQQELRTGIAVTAGYYHNWGGNFVVNDNLDVNSSDYTAFCVNAPVDSRLPGGGGYPLCGLADISLAKRSLSHPQVTLADAFGTQTRTSNFFSVNLTARLPHGARVVGGVDAGRTVADSCFVIDSPEQATRSIEAATAGNYCHVVTPIKGTAQLKLNGTVPVPYGFQLSATFQNLPGAAILANYPFTNAEIAAGLGRSLAACGALVTGCTATKTEALIEPGAQYEDRRTQIDARVAKNFSISGRRLQAYMDIYNVLNSGAILTRQNTFGPQWGRPLTILNSRTFQFGGRFTF